MKYLLKNWIVGCCLAVSAIGLVSIAGCGGSPGSTPTGVADEEDAANMTEEEEAGEEEYEDAQENEEEE